MKRFWCLSVVQAAQVDSYRSDYERREIQEQQRQAGEIREQNRAALEQQRRQFEEQSLQRQTEEINRIGEESRRNDPLNDLLRDMMRRK